MHSSEALLCRPPNTSTNRLRFGTALHSLSEQFALAVLLAATFDLDLAETLRR